MRAREENTAMMNGEIKFLLFDFLIHFGKKKIV